MCPGFRAKVNSNVRMKEFQFYVTLNLEVHPDVLRSRWEGGRVVISSFLVQSVFETWLVDRNLLVRDISLY